MTLRADENYVETLNDYANFLREVLEDARHLIELEGDSALIERLHSVLAFPMVRVCACPRILGEGHAWSFDDQREAAVQQAAESARARLQALLSLHGVEALIELDTDLESWEEGGRFDAHWHRIGWIACTQSLLPPSCEGDLRAISLEIEEAIAESWRTFSESNNRPPGFFDPGSIDLYL